MLRLIQRAFVLVLVAFVASSCCSALSTVCDCVSCLANGPNLPGALAMPAPTPRAATPLAPPAPAARVAPSMSY
ncbi:MAG: hypothetical protein IT382_02170 [Deltaproteobacteria bacterium]|nr:hypothetical protein [Deltaproteobacteria bacterium]